MPDSVHMLALTNTPIHTPMFMHLPMCSHTQTHIHARELCVRHQRDRHSLLGVDNKDLCSAGWSPVSDTRLTATQTWRCTETGAHLGFAGLEWKQSGALRSGAGSV